jgi:hypothetical protein
LFFFYLLNFGYASDEEEEGEDPKSRIVSSSTSSESVCFRLLLLLFPTKLIESETGIGMRVGGGIGGNGGGVVAVGDVIVFGGIGGGGVEIGLLVRFEFWREKFVRLVGEEETL